MVFYLCFVHCFAHVELEVKKAYWKPCITRKDTKDRTLVAFVLSFYVSINKKLTFFSEVGIYRKEADVQRPNYRRYAPT